MKLFLIEQEQWTGYDTYDSAVVVAESEDDARNIHPSGGPVTDRRTDWACDWATSVEHVTARYIGEASPVLPRGVVLASFNAG
jgi:hypothetical protein